ncbi:hypothetical protein D3C79_774870 [compost metagenome]
MRALFPALGPFVAHRLGTVSRGDRARAVLVALRADVFGRVAAADNEQVLAVEFHRFAKVVGVQDTPGEPLEAFKLRHVWGREVPAGHHHVIEHLLDAKPRAVVVGAHGELAGVFIEADVFDCGIEADVVAHPGLLHAALDVVPQHFARRVRGNRPAKVLIEAVVGELQAFLGAVGPQVAVHAAVHRLAMLVEAGAPGVVPHTAPVGLLFEAYDFGHGCALGMGGLEGTQLRKAGRAGTDDSDTKSHSDS